MKTFLLTSRILWKIGMVGHLGRFFPHPFFDFISILLIFVFFDNLIYQGIAQMFGDLYTRVVYKFNLPSKENYVQKANYMLPFNGKWTVFNGGVTKGLSHSWGAVSQRYAYDFIILDDEGKSFSGDSKAVDSYYCYNKDVIAPADGVVVKVSKSHKNSRVNGKKAYCF